MSSRNVAFEIASSPPPPATTSDEQAQSTQASTPPPTPRRPSKAKANPSITPRRFRRFFAPTSSATQNNSADRHALYDITATAQDVAQSDPAQPDDDHDDDHDGESEVEAEDGNSQDFPRDLKRRKLLNNTESSPGQKDGRTLHSAANITSRQTPIPSSPCERAISAQKPPVQKPQPDRKRWFIQRPPKRVWGRLVERRINGRRLQLGFANSCRRNRQRYDYPVNDWRHETAGFHTRPSDSHHCRSITRDNASCIPFCTASLNTNSLIAIGDEEGRVRLLESAKNQKTNFKDTHLAFRVHTNAVIDMTFSNDDSLLATASGDSSARVVDMTTQQTIAILGNHCASLKQVRFQPGSNNNSILATSSRDGSVQIWDLRCKGIDGPEVSYHVPVDPYTRTTRSTSRNVLYSRAINSIDSAHNSSASQTQLEADGTTDAPSRGEPPRRLGDVSVTAINFLPEGQENFLLTASEADASVRLWDIRSLSNRRQVPTPISQTRKPENHMQFRHYGITSMSVNTTGTRLYTLCKDNVVYAYSTAHLILGQAPELQNGMGRRATSQRPMQEALGPIHGYRHNGLQVTSFYVKSAIRKAQNGQSELLAVGSSDGSAFLFPTEERYIPDQLMDLFTPADFDMEPWPGYETSKPSRFEWNIPISNRGTALIRGHDSEVGSVAWTSEGNLVTVGDDYIVRVWRDEPEGARALRTKGESGGQRWGCGWADVKSTFDEDDDVGRTKGAPEVVVVLDDSDTDQFSDDYADYADSFTDQFSQEDYEE